MDKGNAYVAIGSRRREKEPVFCEATVHRRQVWGLLMIASNG